MFTKSLILAVAASYASAVTLMKHKDAHMSLDADLSLPVSVSVGNATFTEAERDESPLAEQ